MDYQQNIFERFIGVWKTSGQIRATSTSKAITVTGTDSYEWLVGQSVILHRVDVTIGNDQIKSAEIIGPNKSDGYFMHSYDGTGDSGVMQAVVKNGVWLFQGQTEQFSGSFSEDGKVFSGLWQQSSDGQNWTPWMDIKLEKISIETRA